ncbi:exonuclease domain-containing protein [Bermanella sp. R86510]|uniref:3'-5' exonuclease n=1 Tax=unclassified Bermanella TaxID=2627862 RepID=UPI0037C997D0
MDTKKIAQDLIVQGLDSNGLVILDTETTGLDTDDQIIEIAIIDTSGRTLLNKLVQATKASNEFALKVHGLTEETLEEHGQPWSTIMPVVNAILETRPVGMYNAIFDERMLQQTCTAHGLSKPVKHQSIDIMELANRHFHEHLEWDKGQSKFKRLSLAKCCEIAGIKFQGSAHRAIVDCHATLDLLKFIARGEVTEASNKQLESSIEYCNYPTCNCPIDKTTICGRGLPEEKTGNVVIAGDEILASIGHDDEPSPCKDAIVIEFNSRQEMGKALRSGSASFSVFEEPRK